MKFKLDENLGRAASQMLHEAGHDVATVSEQDLCSADDVSLIAVCQRELRCLVTLDLEFGNPLLYNPAEHAGIAVLRLPSRPSWKDLVEAVQTLTLGLERESIAGKLWIVQRGKVREYRPEQP